MDRTKAKQLAGGITGVVILTIIVLYSVGAISEQACIIMFFSIIAAYLGVDYLINRNMGLDYKEQNERHLHVQFKKKKVHRTREGNLFELAALLILAFSLFLGFTNHSFEAGAKWREAYVLFFLATVAGLILAYHPLLLSSSGSAGRITNDEQFKLLIRKQRLLAIASALMALACTANLADKRLETLIFIILFAVTFGIIFVFSLLHNKNK